MTTRLTANNVFIGDKFELTVNVGRRVKAGDIVEVHGFDCDGWPQWKVVRGQHVGFTDCDGWSRFNEIMKRYNDIYSDKWVVFNGNVYTQASSEEEAKRAAEELTRRTGERAFIAQATNSVELNALVWDRGE